MVLAESEVVLICDGQIRNDFERTQQFDYANACIEVNLLCDGLIRVPYSHSWSAQCLFGRTAFLNSVC